MIEKSYDGPDFKAVIDGLHIGSLPDCWGMDWEQSQSDFPEDGIDFLQNDYLLKADVLLELPEDLMKAFFEALAIIRKDPLLCRFAWHCHHVLFHTSGYPNEYLDSWPSLKVPMENSADMFPAIICISAFPDIIGFYKEKGIPDDILKDTLSDVRINMEDYYDKNGIWGLEYYNWLVFHFKGMLFKLGRLQFIHTEFEGDVCVFRSIDLKETVALAGNGVKFREDGQVDGTNGIYSKEAWVSHLVLEKDYTEGCPILPLGMAVNRKIKLPFEKWVQVLSKGDAILGVHIPKGDKITGELCHESYNMALSFYEKYFPEKTFKAFVCSSWLLDPQFQSLLPSSSNIVKFQRDFYLYPLLNDGNSAFGYIFGKMPEDLSSAPRDTLLRRVVLDHLTAGNHMRSSGGFILKDNLRKQIKNDFTEKG